MYLSDRDIKRLLPEIQFETGDTDLPFRADDQIQPCSVDLRLDKTFWRQRSKGAIDLRRSKLLELSPRRYWSKITLRPGETITLKPGEMLLGRTFEAFTMPPKYAGKLEGRSSFARMGLAVHCTADFINPGYRGNMPLELINFGRGLIRIIPLVPICQVMFIPLSSEPERVYGARELSSKYMNDDGGPSYWWLDKRITQLQSTLKDFDVEERIQDEILESISSRDPELVERFEKMIRKMTKEEFTNSEDILEHFARSEDWSGLFARGRRSVQTGLAPLLIAVSIGSLFSQPFGWNNYGWLHYLLWTATLLSIPVSIFGLRLDIGDYFGMKDLESLRRDRKVTKPQAS